MLKNSLCFVKLPFLSKFLLAAWVSVHNQAINYFMLVPVKMCSMNISPGCLSKCVWFSVSSRLLLLHLLNSCYLILNCTCLSMLSTCLLEVLESYQELKIISRQQMKNYSLKLSFLNSLCSFDLPQVETICYRQGIFEAEAFWQVFLFTCERNKAEKNFHFHHLKLHGDTKNVFNLKSKMIGIWQTLQNLNLDPDYLFISNYLKALFVQF